MSRTWTLMGALVFLAPAVASAGVSPILGSAGANCPVSDCGDTISALETAGGYPPPFTIPEPPQGSNGTPNAEFKPQLFYVEVPERESIPGTAVPFTLEWFDIDTWGADDVCFGPCDTATIIRVYPPAYAPLAGCTTSVAQLVLDSAGSAGNNYNCAFLQPLGCAETNCCSQLDQQRFAVDSIELVQEGGGPLDNECLVPGVWKVEIDTSQNADYAGGYTDEAYTEFAEAAAQDDLNFYRFAAYQTIQGSTCEQPEDFIKVFAPFLTLGSTLNEETAQEEINTVLFPDIGGGWSTDFEMSSTVLNSQPYVTQVLSPGQAGSPSPEPIVLANTLIELAPLDTSLGEPSQEFDSVRQFTPFRFLGTGGEEFNGRPGYPFNVFTVNAQGVFAVNVSAPMVSGARSTSTFIARARGAASAATDTSFLPTIANSQPIYFGLDTSVNACDETAPAIADGNIANLLDQEVLGSFESGQKPKITQRVRFVGESEDGSTRCYEQEIRLTNPSGSGGSIRIPYDLLDTIQLNDAYNVVIENPGQTVQILAITNCDDNRVEQGFERRIRCSTSTTSPAFPPDPNECVFEFSGSSCDAPLSVDADFVCPGAGEFSNNDPQPFYFVANGTDAVVAPNPVDFQAEDDLNDIVIRYLIAAEFTGGPVYFTGRGANGNRAAWRSEVTPDLSQVSMDINGPSATYETRFGVPSGGSGDDDSEGGTSTSSDGSNDADNTLASVRDIRLLVGHGEAVAEFSTDVEVNSGAFQVQLAEGPDWINAGALLLAHPDRIGATYRARIVAPSASVVELRILEHEIDGHIRAHGPYDVEVERVDVLPELDGRERYSVERPSLRHLSRVAAIVPRNDTPASRARFAVFEEGVYRVSYGTLSDALTLSAPELATAAAAGQLRLNSLGTSVPYSPGPTGLEIYLPGGGGELVNGREVVVSLGRGRIIRRSEREAVSSEPISSGKTTLRFEEDLIAAPATKSFEEPSSFWMWRFLLAGSPEFGETTFTFDAPNVTAGEHLLRVDLRGGSQGPVFPDHLVELEVNGEVVATRGFFGFDRSLENVVLPPTLLLPTGNTLTVRALRKSNVPFSVVWVDGFSLTYTRTTTAAEGFIRFRPEGVGMVRVDGFSGSNLRVWDLRGNSISEVATAVDEGGAGFGALFNNRFATDAEYIVFSPDGVREIAAVTPIRDTQLRSERIGAEYVVITHPSLREAADELALHRAGQGLSTRVVDVFDVYSAYADGRPDPTSLVSFLRDAYQTWNVRPRYVVLMGDGSNDLRDISGAGDNLVSPRLFESDSGRFGSDSMLGDVAGTPGLEIAVGRIPARSNEEALRYLEKMRAFEAASDFAEARRAFVLADNVDEGGDFERSLAIALRSFERAFFAEGVSVDPDDVDASRDRLLSALDDGTRYIHFIGHGGLDTLTDEGVLRSEDLGLFDNRDSPALLLAASCLLGRFDVPGIRTLSESLLLEGESGAAAVFGSAGLEANSRSTELARIVIEVMGLGGHRRLGAALAESSALAVRAGIPRSSLQLHTLLGDPALVLDPTADEWRSLPVETGDNRNSGAESVTDGPRTSGCAATPPGLWLLLTLALLRRRKTR